MSSPRFTSHLVGVFISSTFRDFIQERDELVKKVFPELRKRRKQRFVELLEVDLRWGITKDQVVRNAARISPAYPLDLSTNPRHQLRLPERYSLALLCILLTVWLSSAHAHSMMLERVETGLSDRPGYETQLVLFGSDGSILRRVDLLLGEQLVKHDEEQVVFVRPDGTYFRLQSPFQGRPEPFDYEAEPSGSGETAVGDTVAVAAALVAAGQIAAWFFDSGSTAPVSVPEPAPVPMPTPQAVSTPTPTPEPSRLWTVVVQGDRLQCIDARTGSTQSTINLNGRVVSGPVVSGDYCTLTIESGTGRRSNTYKLPGLNLQNSIAF
jgi:hypothetical protein